MYMTKKVNGFTLLEMVIAIVIAAIVMTGASYLLVQGFRGYYLGRDAIATDWQARIAMERMTRDMRAIRSTNDIATAGTSVFTFNDVSGNNITYQLSGTQLVRILNSTTTNVLATNVTSLSFTYYDVNGIALTSLPLSSANRKLVRYIVPLLQVTYSKSSFGSYQIAGGIYPWNLQ